MLKRMSNRTPNRTLDAWLKAERKREAEAKEREAAWRERTQLAQQELRKQQKQLDEQLRLSGRRTRQPWIGAQYVPDRVIRRMRGMENAERTARSITDLLQNLGGYLIVSANPGKSEAKSNWLYVRAQDLAMTFGTANLIPITGKGLTLDAALEDAWRRIAGRPVFHTLTWRCCLCIGPDEEERDETVPDPGHRDGAEPRDRGGPGLA